MTRLLPFTFFVLSATSVFAAVDNPAYLGLYLNDAKIGYSMLSDGPATWHGKPVAKSISSTEMKVGMVGTPLKLKIFSTTLTDRATGRPIRMAFDTVSGGRSQYVEAIYGRTSVKVSVNNNGTMTVHNLLLPSGAPVTDDPVNAILSSSKKFLGGLKVGMKRTFFVLDPTTVSFVKNVLTYKGPVSLALKGSRVTASLFRVDDPRAGTDVYLDPKTAETLKVVGPLGIVMLPESKAEALAGIGTSNADLAIGSKIVPTGTMSDPANLKMLTLDVRTASDLSVVASDEHQSVKKTDDGYLISIHPVYFQLPTGRTITQAAKTQKQWLKDDVNLPASSPRFKSLARQIVAGITDVGLAARAVQNYVHTKMVPDASIGVLRDANEVLSTCRGVCRDYAILTATLMRSAGIPAKLVTGLVSWDGDFYYHAWVEIFDGKHWVGVDSTTSDAQMSAAHVKLASGTVESAFMAPFLQAPALKIVDSKA